MKRLKFFLKTAIITLSFALLFCASALGQDGGDGVKKPHRPTCTPSRPCLQSSAVEEAVSVEDKIETQQNRQSHQDLLSDLLTWIFG
jgi:hypothetical protein